ncbi:hypothetical protein L2E82_32373 [Cichorium intybus]|uniref:Uncharacterized protein n=1 Tax=Cichorium intybus TaxID=13427 RepID=A0ACB9BH15_CICIN|nr:hypothetical protein L2E82_32373 [Cichorium intybus]
MHCSAGQGYFPVTVPLLKVSKQISSIKSWPVKVTVDAMAIAISNKMLKEKGKDEWLMTKTFDETHLDCIYTQE